MPPRKRLSVGWSLSRTDMDPVALLQRLEVAADAGLPLAPDVAQWLLDGIERAKREGGTLDRALGLSGPGCDSLRTVTARVERDYLLVQAARHLGLFDDSSNASAVAGRLRKEIINYQARVWPRVCHQTPATGSDLRDLLNRAFHTGLTVPTSAKQLGRILGGQQLPRFDVH